MKKRLTLKCETVADLTPGDLAGVVGAADDLSRYVAYTCPVLNCVNDLSLPRCGDITANTCSGC